MLWLNWSVSSAGRFDALCLTGVGVGGGLTDPPLPWLEGLSPLDCSWMGGLPGEPEAEGEPEGGACPESSR